jgi:Flp pilus assembly protein TadG
MRLRSYLNLLRDQSANAAAEMAMVTPLLLILMMGCAELGNYFWNEHTLLKAVRDGARFAARESFSNYTSCSGSPGGTVVGDTQNVVIYGYLNDTSGYKLTPNISAANISVTTSCATTVGGQTMSGLYKNQANGAQIVDVSASVTYRPIFAMVLGFSGVGMTMNAESQAAVTGL